MEHGWVRGLCCIGAMEWEVPCGRFTTICSRGFFVIEKADMSFYGIIKLSRITRTREQRERNAVMNVHVFSVWPSVMFRYLQTSQKPLSFTWEAATEPAAIANTTRALCISDTGETASKGLTIPAAVIMATMPLPWLTLINTATRYPKII